MPIYEYACPGCGKRFEKQLSVFAMAMSAPSAAFAGGGACGLPS